MYTLDTTLEGPSLGSPGAIYQWAIKNGCQRPADVLAYLTTIHQLCTAHGLRFEVAVFQSVHETTEKGSPWASHWWITRCNPAGIGITGDPAQNDASRDFQNGENAARAHFTHLWLYVRGTTLPAGVSPQDDPRWGAAVSAGYAGIAPTIRAFTRRWGADPRYGEKWVATLNRHASILDQLPEQEHPVATSLQRYTDIPGRPGYAFWLPGDIDVRTQVVSHPRVRSYTKFTGQHHDIVHDTGNDKTNAEGEFAWLKGGRQGGSAGGYNAITDSRRIILTGMFDEITWHGGTPTGNQTFGVEMAYGGGQNWDRVLEVNARLHAAICVAFGFDADDQLHLHQWIYGKYCSRQILNRKMWPQYVATVKRYMEEIKAAMRGEGEVIPDPAKYAKPVPIPALVEALAAVANDTNPALTVAPRSVFDPQSNVRFYWVGDRVRAIRDTRRSQYASAGAQDVGGTITKDTEFDVNWLFLAADGKEWYLTPYWTRVLAEDTERVSDSKVDTQEAA